MLRRIIAAVVALVLAAVGVFLVLRYADGADERALAELDTVDVYVAIASIPEGTSAEQLGDFVELQPVPTKFQLSNAVEDLDQIEGRLLTTDIVAGEQLTVARFATAEEIRARADFELPEDARDMHQVTIPLESPRALGGNIAPGDTVGVFISVEPQDDPSSDEAGGDSDDNSVEGEDGSIIGGVLGGTPSMTHLELHKVLVVAVEGSRVEAPTAVSPESDPNEQESADSSEIATETLLVTVALDAPDAEKLVYGIEFGTIWLSLEPEGASEEDTKIVVTTVPRTLDEIRDIYE